MVLTNLTSLHSEGRTPFLFVIFKCVLVNFGQGVPNYSNPYPENPNSHAFWTKDTILYQLIHDITWVSDSKVTPWVQSTDIFQIFASLQGFKYDSKSQWKWEQRLWMVDFRISLKQVSIHFTSLHCSLSRISSTSRYRKSGVTRSGVKWSKVLCICTYNKLISHLMTYANMQKKFSFIKPTQAHLRYTAIQYLVYSYTFQQNSTILMESLHWYLTLTEV